MTTDQSELSVVTSRPIRRQDLRALQPLLAPGVVSAGAGGWREGVLIPMLSCYSLLFSPLQAHISNSRLAPWILIMEAHAGHARRDIVQSVTNLLSATSFLFLGALLAYFCFYLIEYLTPIRGKTVLLWNPTCLTNKFSVFDKIRTQDESKDNNECSLPAPSVASDTSSLIVSKYEMSEKNCISIIKWKVQDYLDVLASGGRRPFANWCCQHSLSV